MYSESDNHIDTKVNQNKEVYAKCQISKTERRSLKRKERLVHSLVTRQLLGRDFEKTFLVTDSPGGNRLL